MRILIKEPRLSAEQIEAFDALISKAEGGDLAENIESTQT